MNDSETHMDAPREEQRLHWLERIINSLGVPTVILIVLGVATYRAAGWLGPYAERIMESHISFVQTSEETLERLDSKLDRHMSEHSRLSGAITELVEEIREDRKD